MSCDDPQILEMKQGTTVRKTVNLTDGTVTDCTGYTMRAKIKSVSGGSVLATWTCAFVSGTEFSMELPAATSSAMTVTAISPTNLEPTDFLTDIEFVRPDTSVVGTKAFILRMYPEVTT